MTRRTVTAFVGPLPLPELVALHLLRVKVLVDAARTFTAISRLDCRKRRST